MLIYQDSGWFFLASPKYPLKLAVNRPSFSHLAARCAHPHPSPGEHPKLWSANSKHLHPRNMACIILHSYCWNCNTAKCWQTRLSFSIAPIFSSFSASFCKRLNLCVMEMGNVSLRRSHPSSLRTDTGCQTRRWHWCRHFMCCTGMDFLPSTNDNICWPVYFFFSWDKFHPFDRSTKTV